MRRRTLNASEELVYKRLKQAAEKGQPCPTNVELCGVINSSSTGTPVKALNKLVAMGLIMIDRRASSRVVTIIETGKQTLAPVYRPPRPKVSMPRDEPSAPDPVDRTPCFRCGTRRDIGCKHHPRRDQ